MKRIDEVTEDDSALGRSEKWKIIKWLLNNLDKCPAIEGVDDVDANGGTVTFTSAKGTEFTIKLHECGWRELP